MPYKIGSWTQARHVSNWTGSFVTSGRVWDTTGSFITSGGSISLLTRDTGGIYETTFSRYVMLYEFGERLSFNESQNSIIKKTCGVHSIEAKDKMIKTQSKPFACLLQPLLSRLYIGLPTQFVTTALSIDPLVLSLCWESATLRATSHMSQEGLGKPFYMVTGPQA